MSRTFYDKLVLNIKDQWILYEENGMTTYIYIDGKISYQDKPIIDNLQLYKCQQDLYGEKYYIPYKGEDEEEKDSNGDLRFDPFFTGYIIENKKGKSFTFKDIQYCFNPYDNNQEKRKLDINLVLKCYKLTDVKIKTKLNSLLAKKLLHGEKI